MVKITAEKKELKHLGFVKMAALKTLVMVSNLYEYAKENSEALRSKVGTMEGIVTTVISPVYDKLKDVAEDVLIFLDDKVDEIDLGKRTPPLAKQVAGQAWSITRNALQLVRSLVSEVSTKGVLPAATDGIKKSEAYFSGYAVKTWLALNQVPTFHIVSEMAVPTAAHWSEKYNEAVVRMTKKGYNVFNYFPLVPLDKIAKAFKTAEAGKDGEVDAAVHQQ